VTIKVHPPLEAARWPVPRDWIALDDLCDGIFDCPHSTPELTNAGPYVARSQDVRTGVFRADEAAHVSDATYQERIARAEPTWGDLLYSREGTYFGIAAEVPKNMRVCLGQRMVLIRPKKGKLDSTFLRLWLNSPTLTRHIHGFRDGTVAERLNMPTIRALPIPDFHPREQEQLASILGSIDEKIELNRQLSTTLEATARAIFEDWFIEYGPTYSKLESGTSYLSRRMWSLFPARFDSDGQPENWKPCALSDLIDLNPPERLAPGTIAPYLDMAALPTSGSWPQDSSLREVGSGTRFRNGDTLLARITPCLENGKTAFVSFLRDGEVGWGSTEFIVMRPRPPLPPEFAYLLARNDGFRDYAIRSMTGTSGRQRVQTDAIREFPLVRPGEPVLREFADLVGPHFRKIAAISGEMRLRDAKEIAPEVAGA
jgi:type I restriction enzyme S subunit